MSGPRWPRALDGAIDGLVVAFAGWTLLYEVALATQRSIRWAGWPWLVLAALCAVVFAVRGSGDEEPADLSATSSGEEPQRWRAPVVAGLGAMLVAAVLVRGRTGLVPMAVVAAAVLVWQLATIWRRAGAPCASRRSVDDASASGNGASTLEHLVAAGISLGLAALASLILKPDADDAYYLNRATWIAHHGVPVTTDTMFGAGQYPSATDSGSPTPSIEALQGSIAYALHLDAATVAYLLWVPALGAILGWTTWRLVRAWAPRRRLLVFAVALAFLLASGQTIVGDYSIARIWQGKVLAVAVLLPVIWIYLSRLAQTGRRQDQILLFLAGVAFVGLTTTSALLTPVVGGAALLVSLVRRSRPLLIGALALLAAPLANGVVEKFGPSTVGPADSVVAPAHAVFTMALGTGAMAVVAVLGLTLAPRLVRGGAGAVAAAISLVTVAAYLPGVLTIANDATGAGPVIWRIAVAAPVPALVGLLASIELPPLPLAVPTVASAVIPVVAIAAVAATSGTWLWSGSRGATLTSHPTWKVDQGALRDLRAAQQLSVPPGRWLLPEDQMTILAISSVGPFAVVPRVLYLPNLVAPHAEISARHVLLRLVDGRSAPASRVTHSLVRLHVSLACVAGTDVRAQRTLAAATGKPLRTVGSMRCHVGLVR